jgi:Mg2+-importing ATPase
LIGKTDDRTGSELKKQDELIPRQDIISLEAKELQEKIGSSEYGLSSDEAKNRLDKYGTNEVTGRKKKSRVLKFLSYFIDPLSLVLVIAGTLTLVTGDIVDSTIIYVIVFFSSCLQFYQEHRAEKASEELTKKVAVTTTVMRDGSKQELPLSQLVPGDIVLLSAGDIVPAGCRIIQSKDLFIDHQLSPGSPCRQKSSLEF